MEVSVFSAQFPLLLPSGSPSLEEGHNCRAVTANRQNNLIMLQIVWKQIQIKVLLILVPKKEGEPQVV